ncbi:MAG: hypothetical protein WC651_01655 [Candidatus Gracilibacteria bacterium]|jgi:hypothetical protein
MAQAYQTKASILSGTDFHEVQKKAFAIYAKIKNRSKRTPYVRSAYFKKEKIFLPVFWQHLWDKEKWQDRMRRLKYYASAIELIRQNKFAPKSKENPNKTNEILHRFTGITKENHIFYVQIKENKRSGRKDLISIFPDK